MSSYPQPPGPGGLGSAPDPGGPAWKLWDRLIIVHWTADYWAVAVETPSGHYEKLPLWFRSYAAARDWLIKFEIEALSP